MGQASQSRGSKASKGATGGGRNTRSRTKGGGSKAEEGRSADSPAGEPAPALTLASLPSPALQQILGELDVEEQGQAACVSRLLNQAVAPLVPGLHHLASVGDVGRVRALLERPDVRGSLARMPGGRITPLHRAAANNHTDVVSALLEAGAPIDAVTHHLVGRSAIMVAAENWQYEAVELLREAGAAVDAAHPFWSILLKVAAGMSDYESVDMLLALGIPPEASNGGAAWTPLMCAADRGRGDIVARLIQAGADAGFTGEGGATALLLACGGSSDSPHPDPADPLADFAEVVDLLLEAGAGLATSESGMTPLMMASLTGRAGVVERLLAEEGVDINANAAGQLRTPLQMAALKGWDSVVAALLGAGAAVNQVSPIDGATALMLSVAALRDAEGCDQPAVVRRLIQAGADVNARAYDEMSVLIQATIEGRLDAVDALIAEGADIHVIDRFGCNALQYANATVKDRLRAAGAVDRDVDMDGWGSEGFNEFDWPSP